MSQRNAEAALQRQLADCSKDEGTKKKDLETLLAQVRLAWRSLRLLLY